ncbi:MAG: carbonic anhydrase [Candidatus Bilamarchaeaceae archaeon]
MQNKNIKKRLEKTAKEYEINFRKLKYTGKIEGIAKKQEPKKLVIGSPFEVQALKNEKELPGTTFGVSWRADYDEVAIASIYYAVSHFKNIELHVVGDKKTKSEIINRLNNLKLLPTKIAENSKEEAKFVSKERIRGVVLSCADSRVLDSAIFGEDNIIINNAGNVISSTVLETVKYYLSTAHIEHITVLGHSNCGAVNAACFLTDDKNLLPIIFKIKTGIVQPIKNIDEIRESHYIENAKNTLKELIQFLQSETIKKISFYVGYHDLNTGTTTFPFGIESI